MSRVARKLFFRILWIRQAQFVSIGKESGAYTGKIPLLPAIRSGNYYATALASAPKALERVSWRGASLTALTTRFWIELPPISTLGAQQAPRIFIQKESCPEWEVDAFQTGLNAQDMIRAGLRWCRRAS